MTGRKGEWWKGISPRLAKKGWFPKSMVEAASDTQRSELDTTIEKLMQKGTSKRKKKKGKEDAGATDKAKTLPKDTSSSSDKPEESSAAAESPSAADALLSPRAPRRQPPAGPPVPARRAAPAIPARQVRFDVSDVLISSLIHQQRCYCHDRDHRRPSVP